MIKTYSFLAFSNKCFLGCVFIMVTSKMRAFVDCCYSVMLLNIKEQLANKIESYSLALPNLGGEKLLRIWSLRTQLQA